MAIDDNNNDIQASKVYELVNNMRLELKADIATMGNSLSQQQGRLEKKFDELEAGRLTRAEGNINDLKVKQATSSVKLAVVGFISASIIGAIVSAVISNVIGG